MVERGCYLIKVPGRYPAFDAGSIHLDADAHAASQLYRERLRATHPAQSSRKRDRPLKRSFEVFLRGSEKRFVSPLKNALRPDVDPRTGSHLTVHHEACTIQTIKF